MKEKLKKFFKAIKGSHAVEAIIITPFWLIAILYCGYATIISTARQNLADETRAFANIIAISETEIEARANITEYIELNELEKMFYKDRNDHDTKKFLTITDVNGNKLTDEAWLSGTNIYIGVTIQTAFTGVRFNEIQFGEYKLQIFDESYTNRCLITLNF